MKAVFLSFFLAAVTAAAVVPTKERSLSDIISKGEITVLDTFNLVQEIVSKFTGTAAQDTSASSQKYVDALFKKLQSIFVLLEDLNQTQDKATKKDNLIDKTQDIQDILDRFVASIVNGTPLPADILALGADTDPQAFITKVIIMAAGNLSKRSDLLSVARVI